MKNFILILVIGIILSTSVSAFAQSPYSGSLNIGANMLMGNFKKVYKSGASVEAGIFYALPYPGMKFTFTVGYNGFKYDESYFKNLVLEKTDEAVVDFYPDWSATDIPIMIGARYKFPSNDISTYLSCELGVHYISFNSRFNGSKLLGNDTLMTVKFSNTDLCTESKAEIGFGASLGAGFEIPIVPKVNLDFGLKYKYCGVLYFKSFEVLTSNGLSFVAPELKNISYITIKAGVVVDF
jgi:hypothetical protein